MEKQPIKQSVIRRAGLWLKSGIENWVKRTFTRTRLIKTAALTILAIAVSIYTHAFQFPSDKEMENKIRDDILDGGVANFEDLFPGVDQVCFLQSYSEPDFLPVPNEEKEKLARFANSYYGTGDHVWWLALIKNNKVVEFYRMIPDVRPWIHRPECHDTNGWTASFRNVHSYILDEAVYFNIQRSVDHE